jgi:hypothetical protein
MRFLVLGVVVVIAGCGSDLEQRKAAVADSRARCDSGNPNACTVLADAYTHENEEQWMVPAVPKDIAKATALYAKACEIEMQKKAQGRACQKLLEKNMLAPDSEIPIAKYVCEKRPEKCDLLAKAATKAGDTALAAEATKKKDERAAQRAAAHAAYEARKAEAAESGGDDDDDAKPASKSSSSAAPKKANGSGHGASRDLACAAAKLQATQFAGCDNIGSAIGGAACDCNKMGVEFFCSTEVTCR